MTYGWIRGQRGKRYVFMMVMSIAWRGAVVSFGFARVDITYMFEHSIYRHSRSICISIHNHSVRGYNSPREAVAKVEQFDLHDL